MILVRLSEKEWFCFRRLFVPISIIAQNIVVLYDNVS